MNSFYYYKVRWYDDRDDYKEVTSQGIISAEDWSDVMTQMVSGFDNIEAIAVESISEDGYFDMADLVEFIRANGHLEADNA